MLPVDRLRDFIHQNNLFQASEKVLLAVSGGRDSVLMAHFFHEAGFSFGIAHCNFMLRGEEAEADETFTRRLAERLKVSFYTTRFDTAAYATGKGISIQMAARELRYEWLGKVRHDKDYAFIATAHHQNDTVETTLLNLVRGTGIAGLHGILPKRGNIIRPLLFLTRAEIDGLVKTENIGYRDDASNFSNKYARNKIRLEVVPKLKELNPSLEATFEANSRRFMELEALLRETVADVSATMIEEQNGLLFLDIEKVKKLKPMHLLLFEMLKPFSFTESIVGDLIGALDGQPGLKFESPTHLLIIDRGKLIISAKDGPPIPRLSISENDVQVNWGDFHLSISSRQTGDLTLQRRPSTAQVDADRLIFPLVLRSWRQGDFFFPLGLKGRKKLSDFFISQKVPLTGKSKIPILENGNGDIIWIGGIRLDDRFKVTPNTKKVYIFELKKNGN